ncbi:MAG TPA: biotin/lipoate A/B protein ligase family protein [Candidatus Norongarragalinales archaeon]|nr:biotin/lipoate A/B protein ligase family protein [Candidatus Norongarragalinales archaeon]
MKWRVIPFESHDAFTNMALDEACSEALVSGLVSPTIRFYGWDPSAVSIGYHQSITDEVNLEECRKQGFDVVRRRTGGGAVYHDTAGEITYSVIAPELFFSKDIIASYKTICGWIVDALAAMGFKGEFKPINDVILEGKKVSGNAQTRRQGILLQHGTLLYDLDVRKMFSVLKVSQEKISDKMIAAVEDRVTSLKRAGIADKNIAYKALVDAFTSGKSFEFGSWTESELIRAKELSETKYKTTEWNFQR